MFKQHCASNNILLALTPKVVRGHLDNEYDQSEIILGDVSLDALEDGLSGESIGCHIIAALIIAGENPADLAGLDFWLDCSNNFLPCLLPCQRSITTIVLEKNHPW